MPAWTLLPNLLGHVSRICSSPSPERRTLLPNPMIRAVLSAALCLLSLSIAGAATLREPSGKASASDVAKFLAKHGLPGLRAAERKKEPESPGATAEVAVAAVDGAAEVVDVAAHQHGVVHPSGARDSWFEWRSAFVAVDANDATPDDGFVAVESVPLLFKEHFNLIHALMQHEHGNQITFEEAESFSEEAADFKQFAVQAQAAAAAEPAGFISWPQMKRLMGSYMDAKADAALAASRREAAAQRASAQRLGSKPAVPR